MFDFSNNQLNTVMIYDVGLIIILVYLFTYL